MLFAIDKNNRRVQANVNTKKDEEYFCPVCRTKVIIKIGEKNIPHFSHVSKSHCAYANYYKEKAQSHRHKKMIQYMTSYFKGYNCIQSIDVEQNIIPNKISDMIISLENGIRFIVECEFKKIDYTMYKDITSEYNKKGYSVLWVFDEKIIDDLSQLASCYLSKDNKLYSLKKIKSNDKEVKNNTLKKDYIKNRACIYLNKKLLLFDSTYVIRIGMGLIKGKKGTIVPYDLDKDDIVKAYKKENSKYKK